MEHRDDIPSRGGGGSLTVFGAAPPGPSGKRRLWCECACGTLKPVNASDLARGRVRSCGCLRKRVAAAKATRHGRANTPEYGVWKQVLQRCNNPKHKDYADYGGRGISVCPAWRDFARFIEDMGERPRPGLTIERTDNAKGYEPGNCVWAPWSAQARNRRPKGRGRKARRSAHGT